MTEAQLEHQLWKLADNRCEIRHPEYYKGIGERSCLECFNDLVREYKTRLTKAHGRLLSPQELTEVRKKLGL